MNKSWGLDIRIDLYDKDRNMVLTLPALAAVSSIKIFKLCINHTHWEVPQRFVNLLARLI